MRTYSELCQIEDFYDRFRYLKLNGRVAEVTFGFDRYLNQKFYKTKEWLDVRREVIIRDSGFDLGHQDFQIFGNVLIHHMNPISIEQVRDRDPDILNPEFLICTSYNTHQAIHYGDELLLPENYTERFPGDTKLW